MKKLKLLTATAIATVPFTLTMSSCSKVKVDEVYRDINLDEDWTFKLNSDGNEQKINLPHDFSIIQKFKHTERDLTHLQTSGTTGFLPGGVGYYHKEFTLPKKDNPTVILNFDGAYNDTTVIVNDHIVGNNQYGYNPFAFDISQYVKADGKTVNKIDVIVRHDFVTSSRWYPGSGIYRDVNISVLDKVHVAHNGTYVTTPNLKEEVGGDVTVNVEVEVQNSYSDSKKVHVKNRVVDASGKAVTGWSSTSSKEMEGKTSSTFNGTLKVKNPKLWSDKTPNLYFVETQVVSGKHIVDQYKTRFGFRYFEFGEEGFSVNGVLTKLHGVCLHHDQGALGAAAYNDAIYRQLSIMKEMGMNAIRTSHNCPDQDLLRICDELGLFVMDEAFDGWEFSKTLNDFGKKWKDEIGFGNQLIDATPTMQWHSFVMQSMVKRDRNCPSVFMWSLGNELHEGEWHDPDTSLTRQKEITKEMLDYSDELKNIAESLDHDPKTKRWCGIALERNPLDSETMNWPKCQIGVHLHDTGGLMGYNYASEQQISDSLDVFDRVYGSETVSAQNTRGVYNVIHQHSTYPAPQDEPTIQDGDHHLTSYDASWGSTVASEALYQTLFFDGYAGQFVWTGFDYIGEPSPWCWNCQEDDPSDIDKWPYPNTAYYGIVDTCGFAKDSYYLYRAHLRQDDTTLHLVGSLNDRNMYTYQGQTGSGFPDGSTPIDIYTNAPYVLIKNGDNVLAKVSRIPKPTSSFEGNYYYTYEAEADPSASAVCKVNDTQIKTAVGHKLYSNILVNPTGMNEIHAEAYKDSECTQLISDTKGLDHLTKITSATPRQIVCHANKDTIKADGKSLAYVTVDLQNLAGDLITDVTSQVKLNVSWSGGGKVVGVDNGDQSTEDKFQNPDIFHPETKTAEIKTWAGKALIIVCSNKTPGQDIKLTINGQEVTIHTN